MNVRTEFITRIKTAATLVSNRVHRIKAPQSSAKPYIAVILQDPGRQYVFGGTSGLSIAMMQAMSVATTYDGAAAVAAQVETAMEGWPAAKSEVQAVNMTDESEDYDVETEFYTVTQTFQIFHT